MVRKSLKQPANLVCGGLLLVLFIYMCVSSYQDHKQQKEIPIRLKKLEEEVKQLTRKIKEKVTEPLPDVPSVEIPHPSREMAQVPIVQEWDRYAMATAMIIWSGDIEFEDDIITRYWNGWKWVEK